MPEFLRERHGDVEVSRQSERYTAADRSKALHVLRGCIVIVRHPYEADPFSGAGNCWCGRDAGSSLHHVVIAGALDAALDGAE